MPILQASDYIFLLRFRAPFSCDLRRIGAAGPLKIPYVDKQVSSYGMSTLPAIVCVAD